MAPIILQLEVTRISEFLNKSSLDVDVYNALVSARYNMRRCIESIEGAEKEAVREACEQFLSRALLSMPPLRPEFDAESTRTIAYIVDRLTYLYHRIPLIY